MTLDKTVKYAGRFGDKDTNSPTGSYKNKTDSSTNDGSFLEQDWANDAYDGLNGAFLANVHDASTGEPQGYTEPTFPVTINGLVDNAQASQVYNAWYKKTNDIVDAKIAELQTIADGCYVHWDAKTNAFPANYSNFINFEAKSDPSAQEDPTYVTSNITISGNEITFLVAGRYSVFLNIFADSTLSSFTTSGTLTKLFLNYNGNAPSTDAALIELVNSENYFAGGGATIASGIGPSATPNAILYATAIAPENILDVNKNDVLKIYTELPNVTSIVFNINRIGKVTS